MLPCEEEFCAFYKDDIFREHEYCSKRDCYIDELTDTNGCDYFEMPKTCDFCKHSFLEIYETGTIDDVEYYCKLQNNKLIYDDLSPYVVNYVDFPKCNIDKFERKST